MKFWASAEVHQPAFFALDRVRRCVEPFLKAAFAESSLATLDCELRYVPIVMPENMHARYPARSKLRKKARLYDCAPILNYDVFVDGTFEDQLTEYLHICAALRYRRRTWALSSPRRSKWRISRRSSLAPWRAS